MQKFYDSVLDTEGNALVGLQVTVNVHDGALASIYDEHGNPATNPFMTDTLGYFEFYAPDGHYDVVISGDVFNTRTIRDIILDDPADIDPEIAAAIQYEADLVQANLDAHIDDPTAAHAASAISNTPAGNIAATTVQAAINELDTEKQAALGFTAVPNTRTVNGHALSADVTVTQGDVGLGNVDNTSDANKPVSTAQAAADAATLASARTYTDTQIASLDAKPQVSYCSTSNLAANYANGSAGVGATLTSTSNGPLIIDGVTTVLDAQGVLVLVAGQSTDFQNGWYVLTQQGVALVQPWILTRDTLSDQAAEIESGYLTSVQAPSGLTPGVSNNQKIFISIAPTPFTVGSDSLTFGLVGGTYAAGTGLSLSGVTFSINQAASLAWTGVHSFVQSGLKLLGASANALKLKVNETLSADRTLNLKVNDADRTIDMSGNLTVTATAAVGGTNTGDQTIASLGAAAAALVQMYRTVDSQTNVGLVAGTWVVQKPDGSLLDITGTATNGLQEAINYAAQYAYDLVVHGGGIKPQKFGAAYGGALGSNPITTTNGSNVVTVAHTGHGLTAGVRLSFLGLGGAVRGIPQAEFEAAPAITNVINANSYTVTLTTNATSSGTGGGSSVTFQQAGNDVSVVSCTTGITVPPIQGAKWDIHATVDFSGAPGGSPPCFTFDSMMICTINFSGQVVGSSAYSSIFKFYPTAELPQDNNGPVITSTTFRCGATSLTGASGNNVIFDASAAPIGDGNYWEFHEMNGNGINGIKCINGAGSGFQGNYVFANDIHGMSTAVNAGTSSTGAANQKDNVWFIEADVTSAGLEIWGKQEEWHVSISDEQGTPANGITLNTTAKKNSFFIRRNDATSKLNDNATERTNKFYWGDRTQIEAHKNGTNQTAVIHATWTTVTWPTEDQDTSGEFASNTFTCVYPGDYAIASRVSWVAMVDQAQIQISIAKNGTRVKNAAINASGAGTDQGPPIATTLSLVAGDTITVQVFHSTGVNQDILGTAALTWLSISRL